LKYETRRNGPSKNGLKNSPRIFFPDLVGEFNLAAELPKDRQLFHSAHSVPSAPNSRIHGTALNYHSNDSAMRTANKK